MMLRGTYDTSPDTGASRIDFPPPQSCSTEKLADVRYPSSDSHTPLTRPPLHAWSADRAGVGTGTPRGSPEYVLVVSITPPSGLLFFLLCSTLTSVKSVIIAPPSVQRIGLHCKTRAPVPLRRPQPHDRLVLGVHCFDGDGAVLPEQCHHADRPHVLHHVHVADNTVFFIIWVYVMTYDLTSPAVILTTMYSTPTRQCFLSLYTLLTTMYFKISSCRYR